VIGEGRVEPENKALWMKGWIGSAGSELGLNGRKDGKDGRQHWFGN